MPTIYSNIDEYINDFPEEIKERLQSIRLFLHQEYEGVEERIGYNMPAFYKNGKYLCYFAGFKNHIGFYPAPVEHPDFKEELANYKTGRGSVQFSYKKELPFNLLKRITELRINTK